MYVDMNKFTILPVENKILPIVHLKLILTKRHPLFFYTFCQKHSGCVFASGNIGSTPFTKCGNQSLPEE